MESDRGTQFVSIFWDHLQQALGTQLAFSTAYHPQTDGQTERENQILEDMLRACVLTYGTFGKKVCHMQSSHTTTAIKPACKWHPLKLCMEEDVVPY